MKMLRKVKVNKNESIKMERKHNYINTLYKDESILKFRTIPFLANNVICNTARTYFKQNQSFNLKLGKINLYIRIFEEEKTPQKYICRRIRSVNKLSPLIITINDLSHDRRLLNLFTI